MRWTSRLTDAREAMTRAACRRFRSPQVGARGKRLTPEGDGAAPHERLGRRERADRRGHGAFASRGGLAERPSSAVDSETIARRDEVAGSSAARAGARPHLAHCDSDARGSPQALADSGAARMVRRD